MHDLEKTEVQRLAEEWGVTLLPTEEFNKLLREVYGTTDIIKAAEIQRRRNESARLIPTSDN